MARPVKTTNKNINVVQSYALTIARYQFSVYEKRILYRLVEYAQRKMQETMGGEPIKNHLRNLYLQDNLFGDEQEIMFYLSDILNISCKEEIADKNYNRVKEAFKALQEKRIEWEDDNTWRSSTFIHEVEIKKRLGYVKFTISKWFWNVIGDFAKGYRSYELLTAMKLKSPYSMRFYELFSKQKTPLILTVENMREMFGLGEKYDRPSNIIARIIKPAKEELDACAPYSFNVKEIRNGDGKTSPIIAFKFFPIFHEENQDKELQKSERNAKLTSRNVFGDSMIYDILRLEYGFKIQEIGKNKATIQKGIEAMGKSDFIDFLKSIQEEYGFKNAENKKGYLIGAIKQRLKEKY